MSQNGEGPFDGIISVLLTIGGCLALLAFILFLSIMEKHGSAIENNIGNKIEAWTK